MAVIRILLVDDDDIIRMTLTEVLEASGFSVTCASNVAEALKCISTGSYDALLSDLNMPGAGDGLTVVSAMRHANPSAVTLLLSAFPNMEAAAQAIMLQADEILVKPIGLTALVDLIKQRVALGPARTREIQSVDVILERSIAAVVQLWFERLQTDADLMTIPMSRSDRCCHLPDALHAIARRLLSSKSIGSIDQPALHAQAHGINRRNQGYTAAMLVGESRMLQISIFEILQRNLGNIDFSLLLIGVMAIADEVDSQLRQAMETFSASPDPLFELMDR